MVLRYSFNTDKTFSPQETNMLYEQSTSVKNNPLYFSTISDATNKEINSLIGLQNVKELLFEIQAYIHIQKKREEVGLLHDPLVLHMIFTGAPGTGKTTIARILGKIFKEMNVLAEGHVVEVERADLVGEYIGHTALKTREQIQKALGGILFIDEAYSLCRGGEKDFGREAIDCIVKAMEDHKNKFILILAGYPNEMEHFLNMNTGLRSRFPLHINFPNYNSLELFQIAEIMLTQREYILSEEARNYLSEKIKRKCSTNSEYNGNARMVRNIIEQAIRLQAVRLYHYDNITKDDLILLTIDDFNDSKTKQSIQNNSFVSDKRVSSPPKIYSETKSGHI